MFSNNLFMIYHQIFILPFPIYGSFFSKFVHKDFISIRHSKLERLLYIISFHRYQAQSDNVSDKMKKVLNDKSQNIKYRHSAEKIELMTRRFEEDGFTSYWL